MSADHTATLLDDGPLPNKESGGGSARQGPQRPSGFRAGFPHKWSISISSVLLLCLAVGLVVGSIALSQNSVTTNNPNFIELSIVPQPIAEGAYAKAAEVGVQNTRTSDIDIIVQVSEGSHVMLRENIPRLAPGQIWTHSFARDASQRLAATVSYASQPTKVVRNVYLNSFARLPKGG
jgi:hypothetical protein